MYRTAYQGGMLTIFFSCGSKPLEQWDIVTKNGYVARYMDQDIKSLVLDIRGANVSTTYITCPRQNRTLGISMPFLVMIVKNLKMYFSFEVTILDSTGNRRRFRVSNFQSTTQITPLCTVMPIGLSDGWNQIQFNLAEFTRRAYNKQYFEVQKLKINANIRLRRIYFAERLVPEDELPPEYRLFHPLVNKGNKFKKDVKENEQPLTPVAIPEEKKGSQTNFIKEASTNSVQSNKLGLTGGGSKAQVVEHITDAAPTELEVTDDAGEAGASSPVDSGAIRDQEDPTSEAIAAEDELPAEPAMTEEPTDETAAEESKEELQADETPAAE